MVKNVTHLHKYEEVTIAFEQPLEKGPVMGELSLEIATISRDSYSPPNNGFTRRPGKWWSFP